MEKTKPFLIGIIVFMVLIVGLYIFGLFNHKDEIETDPASSSSEMTTEETSKDTTATAETSGSSHLPENVGEPQPEANNDNDFKDGSSDPDKVSEATNIPQGSDTEFVPFAVSNTGAIKSLGYAERENPISKKTVVELDTEKQSEYNLESVKSSDGNELLAFGGNCKIYTGTDENGNEGQYIISGATVIPYDGTLNPFKSHMILRKEGTCERVYLFDQQEDADKFIEARERGKEFLENGSDDGQWKIVLNGQYIEDAVPIIGDDGELYVPLRQLAFAYNPMFTQMSNNRDYLYVATDWGYNAIPSDDSSSMVLGRCGVTTDSNGKRVFEVSDMGVGGTIATYTGYAELPKSSDYYWVTPDSLAIILGWETSIKGRVISITSDTLDDTDLYAVVQKVSSDTYDMAGNKIS